MDQFEYCFTDVERKVRSACLELGQRESDVLNDSSLSKSVLSRSLYAEFQKSFVSLAVYLHYRHGADESKLKRDIRFFRRNFDDSLQSLKEKTGEEIVNYALVAYAVWSAFVHDREHAFAPDEKYACGLTDERIREQIADMISPKNIGLDQEGFASIRHDIQKRLHRRINVVFNENESLACLVDKLL